LLAAVGAITDLVEWYPAVAVGVDWRKVLGAGVLEVKFALPTLGADWRKALGEVLPPAAFVVDVVHLEEAMDG